MPIFALVVASVLAATAVMFFVTFNGPPPRAAPIAIEDFVDALTACRGDACIGMKRAGFRPGGGPGGGHDGGFRPPFDQAELHRVRAAIRPDRQGNEREDADRAAAIARELAVPRGDVVAFVSPQPPDLRLFVVGSATIGWRTAGGWWVVRTAPQPVFTRWHGVTLAAMLAALGVLSVLAWGIAGAISRPIRQLADAATRARAGAPLPPLPPGGASEVRDLTRAIAGMHDRLHRHAEGRTAMLGAIAHDLGTPLSRLAFWIEQLPEAARTRAAGDIDEMRAMIATTLVFARDETARTQATRIDLGSLIDSLVEDMAVAGAAVTIDPGPRAIVRGDAGMLRRLFANLLENGVRYGDRAAVGWTIADGMVAVTIADAGPGIDPDQAERLFEPFVRGDPSRNRATGGTGLGLAIVRSIAMRHGGTATLVNGAVGACATVTLPIA